jgi:tetratricopeptide (TPR) repeat protein
MRMKRKWLLIPAAVCLLCSTARAFDTVKTARGTFSGHVVGMTSAKVDLEPIVSGATKEIPVNEVQSILYEGEPTDMKAGQKHALAGEYAEGLAALERVKQKLKRDEMRQDLEFYKAFCAAKLALAGSYKLADAGRMMKSFADKNPNSCHYYAASEIVGDLLVTVRQYGPAADYYARLAEAPWPDYKMKAGVAAGRNLLEQGKAKEAIAAFDKVISIQADGDAPAWQRLSALLGKAAAMAALQKPEEAVKIVQEVIQKGDPDDALLMARAYNALGTAERQAGHTNEALLAFLRVDQLYSTVAETHAEALANLVDLWTQRRMIERARHARQTLHEKYRNSVWAKKVGIDPTDAPPTTDADQPATTEEE